MNLDCYLLSDLIAIVEFQVKEISNKNVIFFFMMSFEILIYFFDFNVIDIVMKIREKCLADLIK